MNQCFLPLKNYAKELSSFFRRIVFVLFSLLLNCRKVCNLWFYPKLFAFLKLPIYNIFVEMYRAKILHIFQYFFTFLYSCSENPTQTNWKSYLFQWYCCNSHFFCFYTVNSFKVCAPSLFVIFAWKLFTPFHYKNNKSCINKQEKFYICVVLLLKATRLKKDGYLVAIISSNPILYS